MMHRLLGARGFAALLGTGLACAGSVETPPDGGDDSGRPELGSLVFVPTEVPDEREDQITFDGEAVPTHTPSGTTVRLGAFDCPSVYKYVHRLKEDTGPLRFAVTSKAATKDSVVSFSLRRRDTQQELGRAEATPLGHGTFEILLTDDLFPALVSTEGELEVVATLDGSHAGTAASEAVACFVHHPLAPPLLVGKPRVSRSRVGARVALGDVSIGGNSWLGSLISGGKANVVEVEVRNGTDYPVYLQVEPVGVMASFERFWRQSAMRVERLTSAPAFEKLCNVDANCNTTHAVPNEHQHTLVPDLLGNGVEVVSSSEGIEESCAGCPDDVYIVPPHSTVYRVVLTQRGFDSLRPHARSEGANYVPIVLAWLENNFSTQPILAETTGRFEGPAYAICHQIRRFDEIRWCELQEKFRGYRVLEKAGVSTLEPIGVRLRSSPSLAVEGREGDRLGALTVDGFAWETRDLELGLFLPPFAPSL